MFAKLLVALSFKLALCNFLIKPPPNPNGTCSFHADSCRVSCEELPQTLLYDGIRDPIDERCLNLIVKIIGTNFENYVFPKSLLPRRTIYELELRNCNFDKIEAEAIAPVTATLNIINSKMRSIENSLFESARNLIHFKFVCETYNDFWIESDAFSYVKGLRTLEIHNCLQNKHMLNLTGVLEYLEVLNLTDNNLTQLESLANFPNLQVINLEHNKLMEIKREAFYGTKLHSINISNNLLIIIEEGIFAHFAGSLIATGNPWNCNDCKLLWFQIWLLRYNKKSNPVKCVFGTNLVDFDFNCSKNNEKVACVDASKLKVAKAAVFLDKYNIVHQYNGIDVNFNGNPVYFTFYDVGDNSVTTIMSVKGFESRHFIHWHDNSNITDRNCVTNIPNYPIPMEFNYGSTYTLCVAEEMDNKVDPNSCFSLEVYNNWSGRTWLPNGQKSTAIILCAVAFTGAVLLAAFCTHICIKRQNKPTKIVIKSMENNLKELNDYQNDYIIPNDPIYETLHYNSNPQYVTPINGGEKIHPNFDSGDYEEIHYKKF